MEHDIQLTKGQAEIFMAVFAEIQAAEDKRKTLIQFSTSSLGLDMANIESVTLVGTVLKVKSKPLQP